MNLEEGELLVVRPGQDAEKIQAPPVLVKLTQGNDICVVTKSGSIYMNGMFSSTVKVPTIPSILNYVTDHLCEKGWSIIEFAGMECKQLNRLA